MTLLKPRRACTRDTEVVDVSVTELAATYLVYIPKVKNFVQSGSQEGCDDQQMIPNLSNELKHVQQKPLDKRQYFVFDIIL